MKNLISLKVVTPILAVCYALALVLSGCSKTCEHPAGTEHPTKEHPAQPAQPQQSEHPTQSEHPKPAQPVK